MSAPANVVAFLPLKGAVLDPIAPYSTVHLQYSIEAGSPRLLDFQPDLTRIAAAMSRVPDAELELPPDGYQDLELLSLFPFLRRLGIKSPPGTDFSGMRHVPNLLSLRVSTDTPFHFLGFIPRLQSLTITGSHSGLVLESVPGLEYLKIQDFTGALSPRFWTGCPRLKHLSLLNGKVGPLPVLTTLQSLELQALRGLEDWSFLPRLSTLRWLAISRQKQMLALPALRGLDSLYKVTLGEMKNLVDLSPLLDLPNLRSVSLFDMRHISPTQLDPVRSHPTLREFEFVTTNPKLDKRINAYVNLPRPTVIEGVDLSTPPIEIPVADEFDQWLRNRSYNLQPIPRLNR
ncbi:MAG: hypothetical protein ACKV22_34150 [Bryobacteraceae bacterium]